MSFIAIEGIDGSGKETQTKMLVEALEAKGFSCATFAFPAYQENIGGKLLAELLAGKRGDFVNADPRLASLPYSIDRYQSSHAIRTALGEGRVVVTDRFSGSNQIHQGGKIKSDDERLEYLEWLDAVEHNLLGVPRPQLAIYLKAPVEVSLERLKEKRAKSGQVADGGLDQVESDKMYLKNSHDMANWLALHYDHWRIIDCVDGLGEQRSREDVHADVLHEAVKLIT
jgi:dTMP kinase